MFENHRFTLVALAAFAFSSPASADTLRMNDGTSFEGKYLGGSTTTVRWQFTQHGDQVRDIRPERLIRCGRSPRPNCCGSHLSPLYMCDFPVCADTLTGGGARTGVCSVTDWNGFYWRTSTKSPLTSRFTPDSQQKHSGDICDSCHVRDRYARETDTSRVPITVLSRPPWPRSGSWAADRSSAR